MNNIFGTDPDALARLLGRTNPPAPRSNPMGSISIRNQGGVNAAYQRMMQYGAQADQDTGRLRRNLTTNLELNQKNRFNSLLSGRQNANDRGMLNSGATLDDQQKMNTNYDATDMQMNNGVNDSMADIARKRLEMEQGYNDSVVEGNRLTTQDAADAQAKFLSDQAAAEEVKRQQEQALAMLQQQQTPEIPIDGSAAPYAPAATQALARVYRAPVTQVDPRFKVPVKKPVVKPIANKRNGPF